MALTDTRLYQWELQYLRMYDFATLAMSSFISPGDVLMAHGHPFIVDDVETDTSTAMFPDGSADVITAHQFDGDEAVSYSLDYPTMCDLWVLNEGSFKAFAEWQAGTDSVRAVLARHKRVPRSALKRGERDAA